MGGTALPSAPCLGGEMEVQGARRGLIGGPEKCAPGGETGGDGISGVGVEWGASWGGPRTRFSHSTLGIPPVCRWSALAPSAD